jgi:hypothetical protein
VKFNHFLCNGYFANLFNLNRFPPQEDVINFVVRTAQRYLKKQPKTLIVVGAYSIGKENVYLAISQALEVLYTSEISPLFTVGVFLVKYFLVLCCLEWSYVSSSSEIRHFCIF